MLIDIDVKDRDLIAKVCAGLDINYSFYTIEKNYLMCRCELLIELESGRLVEVPNTIALSIGRMVQIAWQQRLDKESNERFKTK